MYFKIDQRLPSRNEVDAANRTNRYKGAKMKRDVESIIAVYINIARHLGTIKPTNKKNMILDIKWHEKTKKRDVDNIQSSVKFILDALQKQGIIVNDNQAYISQIFHTIIPDSKDYVEVSIVFAPD